SMRILTQLPQDDLLAVPATARAAETAGFNGLTTSENKNDPFLALAVAAVSTQHASLQTSIAIAFSRSPMAVANASWDLQTASRGRFVLGLGSQVRAHNENRFSVPWTAPAGRMRESFEIAGGGFIATGPDEASVAKMVEWVRYRVAFYGSTPAYWPVLETHGFHDLGRKLNVMSKAGQWDKMAAEISDDVVRLFAAIGTHREIAKASEQRFGGVADTIALSGGYGARQDL